MHDFLFWMLGVFSFAITILIHCDDLIDDSTRHSSERDAYREYKDLEWQLYSFNIYADYAAFFILTSSSHKGNFFKSDLFQTINIIYRKNNEIYTNTDKVLSVLMLPINPYFIPCAV